MLSTMQRRLALVALGALAGSVVPSLHAAEPRAAYGLSTLRDLNDAVTSLGAQARGRHLILVVMKGHWCRVCIGQLARLGALRDRLTALRSTVVGLNADSVKANRAVVAEAQLHFPILSDPGHRVIERLGLWLDDVEHPMPAIVVFDRCGSERGRLVGRAPGQALPEPELLKLLEALGKKPLPCDQPAA